MNKFGKSMILWFRSHVYTRNKIAVITNWSPVGNQSISQETINPLTHKCFQEMNTDCKTGTHHIHLDSAINDLCSYNMDFAPRVTGRA